MIPRQYHGCATPGKVTFEYRCWANMKARCYDPASTYYRDYGGRGIVVCERWKNSFRFFLADMGEKPTAKHTLERINNNGNYEPGNCRWATLAEQTRNRRSTRLFTLRGQTKCLTDWAAACGIKMGTLHARLGAGWSIEVALSTPTRAVRLTN